MRKSSLIKYTLIGMAVVWLLKAIFGRDQDDERDNYWERGKQRSADLFSGIAAAFEKWWDAD